MATSDRKLPAAEASLRAGMSRERLIRTIQRGELKGEILGGRWVVSERSLAEFLAPKAASA
jgi:hypothetical protein